MKRICIRTSSRQQIVDVTSHVRETVKSSGTITGMALCFVPHTTAAVTINENADPDVKTDILHKLSKEFPKDDGYRHSEGNSDAHVKSSLVGSSVMVLVENSELVLGQWQGIQFCEFDGPREREFIIRVVTFAQS